MPFQPGNKLGAKGRASKGAQLAELIGTHFLENPQEIINRLKALKDKEYIEVVCKLFPKTLELTGDSEKPIGVVNITKTYAAPRNTDGKTN